MSDELNDELESQNQPAEEAVNTEEVEDDSAKDESEDLEALKEQNRKLFERAKTAESKLKELKPKVETKVEPAPQGSDLKPGDIVALSKLNEDDIDEVIALAKFKNKPVKEVLKDSYTQAWLKTRDEERKTAAATSVGTTKRPSTKNTGESLLEKAENTGELPDSSEDLQRIVAARFAAKKNKPIS